MKKKIARRLFWLRVFAHKQKDCPLKDSLFVSRLRRPAEDARSLDSADKTCGLSTFAL